MKTPTMTIRIEPELRAAIKALAESTDRSEAGVVKAAVAAYLEANAWQVKAISRALEDVRAGTAAADAIDQETLEALWEDRLARSLA